MQQAGTLAASPHYRGDIEGLRAVAVCMVIAYHSTPRRFPGGFIGVDVFFVISGFLITALLLREREKTGRLSLAGFYARRARRLLPASALVLLSTLLAGSIFLTPFQQFRLHDSAVHTALYISNFWFLRHSDYFNPDFGFNPFQHTWSLAVEEQFYLLWPLLILLAFRGTHWRRNLLALVVLIAGASLALSVHFTWVFKPWAFYSPASRAWEFAAGGIAWLVAPRVEQVAAWLRALASWLGLSAILASGAWLQGSAGWPGWRALLPVLSTVAILLGSATRTAGTPPIGSARVLEFRAVQWLGQRSYSWYLWHWPLLTIAASMQTLLSLNQQLYKAGICAALSLMLAAATHAWLENPIRFHPYLARRRGLSLAGVGLVTLVAAGTATLWQRAAARSVEGRQLGQLVVPVGGSIRARCPSIGFTGTRVAECIGGSPSSSFTVVLFGDSHAEQWYAAFEGVANRREWRLNLITKPACPTARVPAYPFRLGRLYTECDAWREAAIRRILEIHPSLVVIENFQVQNFTPGLKGPNDLWRKGSRETLERFDAAGLHTILLRDTPAPRINVPDCLEGETSWWARLGARERNPCLLERAAVFDEGFFRAEQEAAAGLPHVQILDLSDLFCTGAVCPPVKDGVAVYLDDSHITEAYSRSLAPALEARLIPLL